MQRQITVNGITYNSPDEMPPDVRAQYEAMGNLLADKNQNGVPGVLENADAAAPVVVASAVHAAPTSNTQGQNMGPIVVLTVVAFGLVAILAILLFLLSARAR